MATRKRNKKSNAAKSKADSLPEIEPLDGDNAKLDVAEATLDGDELSQASDAMDADTPFEEMAELTDTPDAPSAEEILDAEFVDETKELAALDGVDLGADAVEQVGEEISQAETAVVAPPPPAKGGGFWGGMFGGVIAAAIGFGTSRYMTEDWPFGAGVEPVDYQSLIDEQSGQVTAQAEKIDAQAGLIEAQQASTEEIASGLTQTTEQLDQASAQLEQTAEQLEQTNAQLAETTEQLDLARAEILTLRGNQDSTTEELAAIDQRFDGLASIDVGELPSDVQELIDSQRNQITGLTENLDQVTELAREQMAALQAEMDKLSAQADTRIASLQTEADTRISSLQTEINTIATLANQQVQTAEQAKAEAAELKEQAAQAAREADARGAIIEINDALSNGGPFAEALPVIAEATEVPEGLASHADTGVETIQNLQNAFPLAARTALSNTTRSTAPEGLVGRLQVLAKDQLGARSLTPKDGDNPDAVLSRAEAAVKSGDLDAAVELVAQLPDEAQEPFGGWLEQVQARIEAQTALDSLTDALGAD